MGDLIEWTVNLLPFFSRMNEKRIEDLESFLQENKMLKSKWCAALDDITDRFQTEFDQLQRESVGGSGI